jgi:hypothetical protein
VLRARVVAAPDATLAAQQFSDVYQTLPTDGLSYIPVDALCSGTGLPLDFGLRQLAHCENLPSTGEEATRAGKMS